MHWSVTARTHLHKERRVGNEDSFFGFSPKELKPKNILQKVADYSLHGVRHSQRKLHKWRGAVKDHEN